MESINCNFSNKKLTEIWINDRFVIRKKIAAGSFGKVYEGQDTHNGNKDIILKVNENKKMNDLETNIMDNLNSLGYDNFPELYSSGKYKNKYY